MIKGQKVDLKANSAYHQWIKSQGIPVLREFLVSNVVLVLRPPTATGSTFRGS